ncbi:MAG: hypothetical protein CL610_06075 [Anaerolineaceae bacterium]|nr:hypothetical protein [Anaerolineaceae bacterium]
MRVNLLHHWRGGSQPSRIWAPGEYDSDALPPRLAEYWLSNGHAERLDDPPVEEVDTAAGDPPGDPDATEASATDASEPEETETPESEDVEPTADPETKIDFSTWNRDDLEAYAVQLGIDLKTIKGTGARGNVIVPDLILAIAEAQQ